MAQFQKTQRRSDTTPRRLITDQDIQFLKSLQTELNTQDTMCNADPRFWVIKQSTIIPASPEFHDQVALYNTERNESHFTLDGLAETAKEYEFGFELTPIPQTGNYSFHAGETNCVVNSMESVLDALLTAGFTEYELRYASRRHQIVPDTLFLTHRECEDHLRKYGYNYEPDAHAFAMTAIRSPQFEQLIQLLQTVDFDTLSEALSKAGVLITQAGIPKV